MNHLELIKKNLSDIRFWIIFFLLIRLYGITNPPLEVAHNWRQTTVTMVARNYYEVDSNIFYPRIDIAGEKTGITGMEFPLLNYLIYLFSLVFGYDHWYGRIINLVVSSIGIYYFFRIIKKYFNPDIAFYSTLVLLCSIWFQYSRKIMPDTFSMSLLLMGIYYGTNYLDRKSNIKNLILYFILVLLGVLSKLPSGFILIIFLPFILNHNIKLPSKIIFSLTTLLFLIPVFYWYFYWIPLLVIEYGFWHFFMGKGFIQGGNEILSIIPEALSQFYEAALKFIGFTFFLYGLFNAFYLKNKILIVTFLLSFAAFGIIILKAGYKFSYHSYYIIPFVPVMALICGYGIEKIKIKKVIIIILILICLEGILNQQHDFRIKDKDLAITLLERDLDKFSNRNDLVLINSGEYPTPMYFAHRKGWVASNAEISNYNFIKELKTKGCKYIIILKQSFGTNLELKYQKVFNNDNYSIYKL